MEPTISRLPLWATVKSAYRLAWEHRVEYLKISRWWLAIALPIMFLYNWLVWDSLQPVLCFSKLIENAQQHIPPSHELLLISLPRTIFLVFFGSSIAVAWHRLILRNEHIGERPYLRFDNVVWGYFIFGLFLQFLTVGVSLFVLITKDPDASVGTRLGESLILLVLMLAVTLVTTRLSVMLPAKALALQQVTIKDVWERTRSNFWRIFLGAVFCTLPVAVVGMVLKAGCRDMLIGVTLYTASIFFYIIVAAPVALAFLSLSYQHFFEKDGVV